MGNHGDSKYVDPQLIFNKKKQVMVMIQLSFRKLILLQLFALLFSHFIFADDKHQIYNEEQTKNATWILDYIHPVADFPKEGVQFQWYAHLLREPEAFSRTIIEFTERYRNANIDVIACLDSRGFIFGAALAYELKLPFILIRKPGKLPGNVEKVDYELEYGHNSFEIETDSLKPGYKVLIVDDVVATGGTAAAACALIERLGGEVVEVACLIELPFLQGRSRIVYPVFSLISINVEE